MINPDQPIPPLSGCVLSDAIRYAIHLLYTHGLISELERKKIVNRCTTKTTQYFNLKGKK